MPNGLKIRGRIVEQGLTLGKVAEMMGMSQPTLSQKIFGQRNMHLEEADRLGKLLGIPQEEYNDYFFAGMVHDAPNDDSG